MEYFTQWNFYLQKNLDSSTPFIPRKTSQNFSVTCHLSSSTARKPQKALFPSVSAPKISAGDKHTERTKLSNHIIVGLFPVSVAQTDREFVFLEKVGSTCLRITSSCIPRKDPSTSRTHSEACHTKAFLHCFRVGCGPTPLFCPEACDRKIYWSTGEKT